MLVLFVLSLLLGRYIDGKQGMQSALIIALFINSIRYWYADRILEIVYHRQLVNVDDKNYNELYTMIKPLAQKIDLPVPKVYVVKSIVPNAFTVGRNSKHAVIYVTTALLWLLNVQLLMAVLGHELGHIHHKDTFKRVLMMNILLIAFYMSPLAILIIPIKSYLFHRQEEAADLEASKLTSKNAMALGLITLMKTVRNKKVVKIFLFSVFMRIRKLRSI